MTGVIVHLAHELTGNTLSPGVRIEGDSVGTTFPSMPWAAVCCVVGALVQEPPAAAQISFCGRRGCPLNMKPGCCWICSTPPPISGNSHWTQIPGEPWGGKHSGRKTGTSPPVTLSFQSLPFIHPKIPVPTNRPPIFSCCCSGNGAFKG